MLGVLVLRSLGVFLLCHSSRDPLGIPSSVEGKSAPDWAAMTAVRLHAALLRAGGCQRRNQSRNWGVRREPHRRANYFEAGDTNGGWCSGVGWSLPSGSKFEGKVDSETWREQDGCFIFNVCVNSLFSPDCCSSKLDQSPIHGLMSMF